MKYCKNCVQPDTRPGLVFDENEICSACLSQEETSQINWDEREQELSQIVEWAKNNAKSNWDCAAGVSGGKDSTFIALYLKDKLGLKPLLVNCTPDNIMEVGRENLENLVQHGFDMVSLRPNPKVLVYLSRKSFYKYGNIVKPSEYPLWASVFRAAKAFEVPLIVLGENPASTLGVKTLVKPGGDAFNIRSCSTLGGASADIWEDENVGYKDLILYDFPNYKGLEEKHKAIFLGHYAKEWSFSHNTDFAIEHGLKGRPDFDPNLNGRLNKYASLEGNIKIVNQMLKYYKLGFGCVTDEVCYYIRDGSMTREEGIDLVKKYDGKCGDNYLQEVCDYIGISVGEFWDVTERNWLNSELFYIDQPTGKWIPKFKVGYGLIES